MDFLCASFFFVFFVLNNNQNAWMHTFRRPFAFCINETHNNTLTLRSMHRPFDPQVAVVLAFFICWAPFHAQRLMATHVTEPTPAEEIIFGILTHISGIAYYISATINPILYSIMSLKFRQAFKDTLGRCCGRNRAHGNHLDDRTCYLAKSQAL